MLFSKENELTYNKTCVNLYKLYYFELNYKIFLQKTKHFLSLPFAFSTLFFCFLFKIILNSYSRHLSFNYFYKKLELNIEAGF